MTFPYAQVADELAGQVETLEAEVERLRLALGMAIYHADNLRRYIDHEVVRDLDESSHGLERARGILEASA